MQRPCVLLVEDDPAVRRFVQLALEPLSVELVSCATLAEAQQVLIASSPQLVLTDLTLPDGSGLDLLHWLHDRAQQPSGLCRTVVFSGGIDPTMERKLKALQVWRVLHKPASVGSLMACVADALAAEVQAVQSAAAVPQSDPVAEFFGGNRPLYDAYRAASVVQLVRDLDDGDRAVRAGDLQALRRVAHNLKSALAMLGQEQAVQVARATEEHAAKSAAAAAQAGWKQLSRQVRTFVAQGG